MANQPPTKCPPYPKVKYTDAKFREIMPSLPLEESHKVQYKAKGVWFRMITKHGNFYNCECCGIANVGRTPFTDHLRGKKHRLALHAADKLFHPQYTAPKPTNSPPRTPILDACMGVGDKPKDVSGLKAASTQQKPKPGPASAQKSKQEANSQNAQKPKPDGDSGQKSKPDGDSEQKPKPEVDDNSSTQKSNPKVEANTAQKKPTPVQKPGPASSKKPMNAAKKATPAETAKSNASPASASEQSDSKEEVTSTKNENDEKNSEESAKPTPVVATDEIVILDDDDEDENENKQPAKEEPVEKPEVGQAIPVTGNAVPKAQRPQKQRNLPAQAMKQNQNAASKSENDIAPADRILNPAAVVAQSAEQPNNNEKPNYQQNRVIIPTANKKKEAANQQQQAANQQPNFSKRTFTPKVAGTEDCEGIIGVEYVVKILKVYNDPDPFYECCLCEVVMDGIGMQTHLVGYNHRYKYIEKHFPTCFNQYKDHIGNIQVLGHIMDRVAKAIESHHGRELPYECLSGEFRANRHGVMTTVYSFRHASEYSGPSFTNVLDAKEVDELYKNKVIYVPKKADPKRKPTFDTRTGAPAPKKGRMDRERERDRDRDRERELNRERERDRDRERDRGYLGSNRGTRRPMRVEPEPQNTVDDATHKLLVEEFLNNTRGKSRSPGGRRRRHRSRSRSPQRSHRRRSVSPLREGDIWQAYRHLVDRSKNELDQVYKEYRKDPEKHPVYDEEWRKFWKHRKEQLTREGLDHRNYDFQPEWVRYFAVRIEELYDEAVEDIKISSRRRLILPMTNDELEDKKYHVKVVNIEREQQSNQYQQEYDQHGSKFPENDKTSVVSVLRLLTALEDYLGSLGPKVVDLLSKALLVEKTNPREINEIILNLENCTILETAMEKLKGVLIAGLLEGPKVRAFNNVITETDKILRIAYKIRRENPQPLMNRPHEVMNRPQAAMNRPQPVPVPAPKALQQDFQQKSFSPHQQQNPMQSGSGGAVAASGAAASLLSQIDKKELATKLAAALTAQGKTDFNPEQLQQLIAVYSLIDKKKRDSAAASDKQKMTLSDTLTALLNPSGDKSIDAGGNRMGMGTSGGGGGRGGGGGVGGNFSNSNDKYGSLSNSSINNFVSMLNRDGPSAGGNKSNGGDSEMWQNLQNIQSSLRLQNNASNSNIDGGFGNNSNSANAGRNFNNNSMAGGGSGNFNNSNRSGFGGQSDNDFNSGKNFNRSGFSDGNTNSMNSFEAGFRSSFQGGMNNSNPSRVGNDDMVVSGGRGINDMMGRGNDMRDVGGRSGNDMISRGRGGNDMMTGGRGGNPSGNSNNFSTSSGGNFSSRGQSGTGANNTLGFTRGSFLGSSNFSGLSNFSTSITPAGGLTNFSRSSLGGMGSSGGSNLGSNNGGGNFNRGGNSGQSNFGGGVGGGNNFNNQQNKNNQGGSGGGPSFGSAPNPRNIGGNPGGNNMAQASRSGVGSNWRNQ
ncbi:uncharacterized protein LOC129941863 [Eupeodes corollae]|uniref:uncharacterized protein LOC129941863 n=1 Tax=Eupeodes corollae TaxID=290404 RepID=UPI002492BC56|nr:uncharacterized protein LOC129941863 [Eupeodes corollae]XP_055906600.1 uncharacterized protein LOC129941863 [Eupeodes corollae]